MPNLALCIGIDDYNGVRADLRGAVNDANDWAEQWEARGFVVAEPLVNRAAGGPAIRSGIETTLERAERGDTVVIVFSGHGSIVRNRKGTEPDGYDECLCPWSPSTETVIVDDEVGDMLRKAPQGARVVFIADACHSGTMTGFAHWRAAAPGAQRPAQAKYLPTDQLIPRGAAPTHTSGAGKARFRALKPANALELSSCLDFQESDEHRFGAKWNGVFTHFALQELRRLQKGDTFGQWLSTVRDKVANAGFSQVPAIAGGRNRMLWRVPPKVPRR